MDIFYNDKGLKLVSKVMINHCICKMILNVVEFIQKWSTFLRGQNH